MTPLAEDRYQDLIAQIDSDDFNGDSLTAEEIEEFSILSAVQNAEDVATYLFHAAQESEDRWYRQYQNYQQEASHAVHA